MIKQLKNNILYYINVICNPYESIRKQSLKTINMGKELIYQTYLQVNTDDVSCPER